MYQNEYMVNCMIKCKWGVVICAYNYIDYLIFSAAICYTCKSVGDIANLMYCSSCGTHYHGSCVGLAQLPGEFNVLKGSKRKEKKNGTINL